MSPAFEAAPRHDRRRAPLDDVRVMFPDWEFWQGIAGLCYARKLLTSPPVVLRGEDPCALRGEIVGWLGRQR